jgi:hypothetical protein
LIKAVNEYGGFGKWKRDVVLNPDEIVDKII